MSSTDSMSRREVQPIQTNHRSSLDVIFALFATAAAALLVGALAAWAILVIEPFSDPKDIVGLPILRGYSEKTEQYSLYVFVVVGAAAAWFAAGLNRGSTRWMRWLGAVSFLVIPVLATFQSYRQDVLLAFMCYPVWFAIGSTVQGRWLKDRPSVPVAVLSFVIALAVRPDLAVLVGSSPMVTFAAGLFLALAWLWPRIRRRFGFDLGGSFWLLATVVCLIIVFSSLELVACSFGGFAMVWCGMLAGRSITGWQRHWAVASLVCLGLHVVVDPERAMYWPYRPSAVIQGAATGLLLVSGAPGLLTLTQHVRPFPLARLLYLTSGVTLAVALFHAPAIAPYVMAAGLLYLLHLRNLLPGRFAAWACACCTILLLLPGWPSRDDYLLDWFHDGQILSAVWEYEQGAVLYEEVFPLRSFEFWAAWLVRRVFHDSLDAYLLSKMLFKFLMPAGVLLMTYFATKHLDWSIASALSAMALFEADARVGAMLVLGAMALAAVQRLNCAVLVIVACIANLMGFDAWATVVASAAGALTATLAFAPRRAAPASPRGWREHRVFSPGVAAAWVGVCIACWSALLALWQGPQSVQAYWSLFLGYSVNYPSFYGMPFPWHLYSFTSLVVCTLAGLALLIAIVVASLSPFTAQQKVTAAFLLMFLILATHRGLGRTDSSHLRSLYAPLLVASSVTACWLSRVLCRSGVIERSWLAPATALWMSAALLYLPEPVPLRESFGYLRAASVAPKYWPDPPEILRRSSESDFVWDIEDGLVNFLAKRHNPTRHALSYCIGWPEEQLRAVSDMKRRPPATVRWQFESGSNDIANPLRFYVLVQHLYENFEPAPEFGWLVPRRHEPVTETPDWVGKPLVLDRLPLNWGRSTPPYVHKRLRNEPTSWQAMQSSAGSWEPRTTVPREANFLRFRLRCRQDVLSKHPKVAVYFASHRRQFREEASAVFEVLADGREHEYLVPIGCSPFWSWGADVQFVRIKPLGVEILDASLQTWSVDLCKE